MTAEDLGMRALAAGFATDTLDGADLAQAKALMAADPAFASLVKEFAEILAAEGEAPLPDTVWQAIERRLTPRRN